MKKSQMLLTLGIVLFSSLGLAACSNSSNSINSAHLSESYSSSKPRTKKGDDSTLKVAEVADSPFSGMPDQALQTTSEDTDMYSPGDEGNLFKTNSNYEITKGGLANLKLNKSNNTALVTLRKNARWSNGMKVTAKDVEYPYEMIANKNSKSQQFSNDMDDIIGMKAYHAGKAPTISGITFPDGPKGRKTLFHFNYLTPALKNDGNDFMWGSVSPYEYLKNIPISKLSSSTKLRKHPIFTGAYKLKNQVTGEDTVWVPNPYYYGKKPHIKRINIQVVSSTNFNAAIKAKKYDFAFQGGTPTAAYKNIKKLNDYTEVGLPDLGYNYIGFNLGEFKHGKNIMYKHGPMNNPALRRAMMYSLDLNKITHRYSHGLAYRGNTLIPLAFHAYHASYKSQPGFPYNMKKARALLRKAGYRKDGHKYLRQPNGKKLVIRFGVVQSGSGGAPTSPVDLYYVQQWRKLGLDAKIAGGQGMEANSFYSTLEKPKQDTFNVFESAVNTGSEPTPTGFYGTDTTDNFGHFSSKENTKLLKEMNDKKSFNTKHRIKIFKKWQKYMNKEAPYAPEYYGIDWTPVNHRVTGFSLNPADTEDFWSNLGLNSAHLK